MIRHDRRLAVVAAALCLAFSGIGISASSGAEAPASSRGLDQASDLGQDESDSNSRISTVMDEVNFLFELPGYSVSVADDSTSTLNMYWKGEPPAEMDKAHSIAEEHGVKIVVTEAPYSEADLDNAASQVLQTAYREGIPVSRAGYARDGSGLIVTANGDITSADRRQALEVLEAASAVPIVEFETTDEQVMNFDRVDMESPFKGGGTLRVRQDGGPTGTCTAGFAVLENGNGRLLSAGHCAPAGNPEWIRNGAGDTIAPGPGAVRVRARLDSLLIDPNSSPATIGKVFHGGMNTNNRIGVAGFAAPGYAVDVCISGGNTSGAYGGNCSRGEIVWIGNFRCGVSPNPSEWRHQCPGFRVRSTDNDYIAGQGDSGAPVYIRRNDGRAGARGILVSGIVDSANDTCPNEHFGNPLCGDSATVVRLGPILRAWDVTLEHGG